MMSKRKRNPLQAARDLVHGVLVLGGAAGFTLAFFLILPLMQAINDRDRTDLTLHTVDTAQLEAPEPPPEPEPEEEEPEAEEEPPALAEEAPPLDLSQLELALNPGFNEGWAGGDFTVKLTTAGTTRDSVDSLFSIADLDQKPRVVYQSSPIVNKEIRQKAPGTVYVVFVVNEDGRVEQPQVQKSTDPAFERPAVAAVSNWRFEPGKRNGQPVRFRMRVPITFPKGA